ncbi:MAG: D-alanyl-D-alanine carboxypeptidase [Hyphomicrobiales bacterium]|nr:D-alanyl-D-alanine carboxypeptidase [Hyphomicrobiales bacterium]MBV8825179.1 D-alanyl-D-alanine carboxypeptidase [Hyphomicrobiales bacterium]MBV9426114.1 D-alanyl-D-alanine carboxypeptidase [Bradyrhizobiaceae bacterium]
MAFVLPFAATTIGSSDTGAKTRATDADAKPHATEAAAKPRVTDTGAKPRTTRKRVRHAIHGAGYRPAYADIMVDDNSGQVLHETDPDAPRHPASLTKVMTLYLLFGELEAGRIKLDYDLAVSARAAEQNPTKLGLRAGQTIKVEDAIKGLVTKSANDAAVVVAEALGGSEEDFARMMTRKARALGMSSTTYVNASGLPADEQITTARDQALLGRAIMHRFPQYYSYFSLPAFAYRGRFMSNHNSLLRTVDGVDGIKTGYTESSGYNLISSTGRSGRRIVGVILGERSNGARDVHMRNLIEQCIPQAATQHTAPEIVERKDSEVAAPVMPANFNLSSTPAADAVTPVAPPTTETPAPVKLPSTAFQSAP